MVKNVRYIVDIHIYIDTHTHIGVMQSAVSLYIFPLSRPPQEKEISICSDHLSSY